MTITALAPAETMAAAPGGLAPTDLTLWAQEARQINAIAVSLAGTSFVPKTMQGRPDEVTGCILVGRELGLPPMAALRAIDIIDGTPALRAHALRGLVQARGHSVWVEDSTATRAVVCGSRFDKPNQVQRAVWTTERAKTANLLGKKNWAGHTQAMLVARATAELCRMIASDALIGMPYSAEEVHDEREDDAPAVSTLSGTARKAQRKVALKAVTAEVPLPEVPAEAVREAAEEQKEEPPRASRRTIVDLMAAFAESPVSDTHQDREARIAWLSEQVGRPISTATELSEPEAQAVIAQLRATEDNGDAAT